MNSGVSIRRWFNEKIPLEVWKTVFEKPTGVFERGWRLNYYKLRIVG
jgi:hypothetical protein